MKNEILKYYNDELYYLREASEKFAEENPQIAQNLGLEGFTCTDPYIERLLEGFAFLAARVHYQLNSDFSKFTQVLLNNIYPDYQLPCPSSSIVNFKPDYSDKSLETGAIIPKNTILNTLYRSSAGTTCTFTTTQDVTLWPIEVANVYYSSEKGHFLNEIANNQTSKAFLSVELNTIGNIKFSELPTDHLDFNLSRASMKALMTLYEQLFADTLAIIIEFEDENSQKFKLQLADVKKQLLPIGFEEKHSLLPHDLRNYSGHRLLREYFSFPNKFLFFRLDKLQDAFKQINSNKITISFLFKNSNNLLESSIRKKNLSLYSTPVVNLFKKRLDRQILNDKKAEVLINADNTKLYDYEIIKINKVEGYNSGNKNTVEFKPFYKVSDYDKYNKSEDLHYYNFRREFISEEKKKRSGSDMYLSIVNIHSLNSSNVVKELAINALCSNRKIPMDINLNSAKTDFTLNKQYPINGVKFIMRPTSPNYSTLSRKTDWSIINHLKINYKNILNNDIEKNTEIIKDLIKLYASNDKLQDRKQVDGITLATAKQELIKLKHEFGVSFGPGLFYEILFDENSFSDSGFFLLANIIHLIIGKNISINTLIKTKVTSSVRGEIIEWKSNQI